MERLTHHVSDSKLLTSNMSETHLLVNVMRSSRQKSLSDAGHGHLRSRWNSPWKSFCSCWLTVQILFFLLFFNFLFDYTHQSSVGGYQKSAERFSVNMPASARLLSFICCPTAGTDNKDTMTAGNTIYIFFTVFLYFFWLKKISIFCVLWGLCCFNLCRVLKVLHSWKWRIVSLSFGRC